MDDTLLEPALKAALAAAEAAGLRRGLRPVEGQEGPWLEVEGRRLLSFSSNDYLGLSHHPRIIAAAHAALDRWGFGAGASRLITGDRAVHEALEAALARLMGTEAARLFTSGYHANTGALPALAGSGDRIFSDALNHASLIDGCRLSRAEVQVYPHRDLAALERLLVRAPGGGRRLIVTDAVFSMDGDRAPLSGLVALAEQHGATLFLDEAHALGVLGPAGRPAGLAAEAGLEARVALRMGTLGKALGTFGAFVAGSAAACEHLLGSARSFVFTTALPPVVAAAALEALAVLQDEGEARRARLFAAVDHLRAGLSALGLAVGPERTPILPLILGSPERTLRVAGRLLEEGLWVHPIRPPTVPEGSSRLRIALSADHGIEEVDRLLRALPRCLEDTSRDGRSVA
ncbi:MAG: 8-amino-7-oxononanoate synthase [Deltaproteobacteria bacterium]|nr:8-amino-7-oxononanoate synthase [Deltaproteobacteria bacterium]